MFSSFKVLCLTFYILFCNALIAERLTHYSPIEQQDKKIDHFSYVNPDAPKGGSLIYGKEGVFANFNPFFAHGTAGCASIWTFDRLMFRAFDELMTYYPLVAEEFTIDDNSVTFFLHVDAKWSNGEKITANDVKNAFNSLTNNSIAYIKFDYRDVKEVNIINDETINFVLRERHDKDLIAKLMNIPLITPEAFEDPFYTGKVSGAYYVADYMKDEFINYRRNQDYWAQDLPINRGRFNFDNVLCKYYNNYQVAVEAFKAGEYDIHNEKKMKNWQLNYQNVESKNGYELKKIILESRAATANKLRTLSFNTQQYPFNKLKVRKALSLLFDFEKINKMNFLDSYERAEGLMEGSEFVKNDKIFDQNELKLLKSHGINIDLLSAAHENSSTLLAQDIKTRFKHAIALLAEEGFKIVDGKMVDESGTQLKIKISLVNAHLVGLMNYFVKILTSFGMKVEIDIVDTIKYTKILKEKDFSIINYDYYFGRIPGVELYGYLHSNSASKNYLNVQRIEHPDLDKLIYLSMQNEDFIKLKTYLSAINRIFVENYYAIFLWHNPYYKIVAWDKFEISDSFSNAKYYDEKNLFGADSWWQKTK